MASETAETVLVAYPFRARVIYTATTTVLASSEREARVIAAERPPPVATGGDDTEFWALEESVDVDDIEIDADGLRHARSEALEAALAAGAAPAAMRAMGFTLTTTGGNCTAWEMSIGPLGEILVSSGDQFGPDARAPMQLGGCRVWVGVFCDREEGGEPDLMLRFPDLRTFIDAFSHDPEQWILTK